MRLSVINLLRRADRKAQFMAWNARAGLELAFVEAVDGREVNRQSLVRAGLLVGDPDAQTAGSLGNLLSKRRLWNDAADASSPVLFCEDDACLRGDFVEQVRRVLAEIDVGWDIIYFGYNTDAITCVQSRDGLSALLYFDGSAKQLPDYFERFSRMRALPSTLIRCHQVWGTLCCAVSPEGGRRLLEVCRPLGGEGDIELIGQNRRIRPYGMDGLINLALQRREVRAFCVFPPLAVSTNDATDSDIAGA